MSVFQARWIRFRYLLLLPILNCEIDNVCEMFRKITYAEIKEMDIVSFLSSIGFEPQQIRRNDYWYLSPLRNENDASFKVNRKLNRWYDFALGQGGNLVDFGVLYFECTIGELLARFTDFAFDSYIEKPAIKEVGTTESPICITSVNYLSSIALLRYLKERRIPYEMPWN